MESFAAGSYKMCIWVTKLAYLNFLWVLFTIVGLGVFGFMPATSAMFSVVRKWNLKDTDIPMTAVFLETYKKEFITSNVLGFILAALGYLFIAEIKILQSSSVELYNLAGVGVIIIFMLYSILVLYFFPIFVHFNLKIVDYFKWPFIIGIIHPVLSVFLFVVLGIGLYIVFNTIPALIFFCGGSATAYIVMWGVSKTFSKYELNEG